MELDRNALLIYLRNLRDLEIAKRRISALFDKEQAAFNSEYNRLSKMNVMKIPEKASGFSFSAVTMIILVGALGVAFFGTFLYLMLFGNTYKWSKETIMVDGIAREAYAYNEIPIGINFAGILGVVVGIGLVFLAFYLFSEALKESKENKTEIRNAYRNNESEKVRVRQNSSIIRNLEVTWRKKENYLRAEYRKVCDLLNSCYGINILANQYRNLPSLYYIYDYMASSQETLKDTLIHEHMENGIKRILDKLDYIIEQNQEIIFQNRIQESQNKQLIKNTDTMIKSLEQTENNTQMATQYSKISATYNQVQAYFSLAAYLKS